MKAKTNGILLSLGFVLVGAALATAQPGGSKDCQMGHAGCWASPECFPNGGTCQKEDGTITGYQEFTSDSYYLGYCMPGKPPCAQSNLIQCSTDFHTVIAMVHCEYPPICHLDSYSSRCPDPPA
jgi:hypothetical protein